MVLPSRSASLSYSQVAGIDEPLSELRSGAISYYGQDGLGSVTSLSDSGGTLASTYVYDSFGNLTSSTGTVTNPYQYTGRDYDAETGLRYYRARYYDSSTGRFMSEDPLGFGGGNNFYIYVADSATNFVDPFGLDYSVTQSGDTITVSVTIGMYGEGGSQELAQSWQNQINQIWNAFGMGWRYKGCKVKFDARIVFNPAARSYLDFTTRGWNALLHVPSPSRGQFRSRVAWGYYGVWWAGDEWGVAGHEFGHFLGLPDYYREYWHGIRVPAGWGDTSVPIPGHAHDIMADYTDGGVVTQSDVDQVLAGRTCGCKK